MGDTHRKKLLSTDSIVNVVLVVAAVSVLLSPANPLSRKVRSELAKHKLGTAVREAWPTLVSEGSAIGVNGDIVAVEFADYQCPYCRQFHSQEATDDWTGKIIYRHFPLSAVHEHATTAALASICAERDGRFQGMHNFLMENEGWYLELPDWRQIGETLGIDGAKLTACMKSEWASDRLARDLALAETLGLRSTPSFVMQDGGVSSGMPSTNASVPWR